MEPTAPFIVTIDGPAGVGKSTLAKRLAAALGIAYLDTGAMFRSLALYLAGQAPSADPEDLLSGCRFTLRGVGDQTELLCNGRLVGDEIRSEEAGMMAAQIGALKDVREALKAAQREMGSRCSLVAEGRDMGTVVFPAAPCKLFLDAKPEVRAKRRLSQLEALGTPCDLAELTERIRLRDEQDTKRSIAPLRPAQDALIIDTSSRDIEDVFGEMLRSVAATKKDRSLAAR